MLININCKVNDFVRYLHPFFKYRGYRGIAYYKIMKNKKSTVLGISVRYFVATLGLVFVAIGVALSIKSDLGTAPISCPTYVVNLWNAKFTVGEYTIMLHLTFILSQILMLGKKFKVQYLMQIPAAVVFGLLTDGAIAISDMIFSKLPTLTYTYKMGLCILTVIVTALGISLEVIGNAWMLAGEQTVAAISQTFKVKFNNAKIGFDIFLVILSGAFALIMFGNPWGKGDNMVIREGTLILALFTGLCMKLTDPIAKKLFGKLLSKYE